MIQAKRSLLALLMAALCTSAVFAAESGRSRKTYLATRPAGMNLGMEYTTWHQLIHTPKRGVHTRVQATGFFNQSQNGSDLGRYFGVGNNSDSFRIGTFDPVTDVITKSAPDSTTVPTSVDIDGDFMVPVIDDTTGNAFPSKSHLSGLVRFRPRQEQWGVRFELTQDINCPCDNLFFNLSVPVVHVSNDMRMRITEDTKAELTNQNWSLADFFAGRIDNSDPSANGGQNFNMIAPLTNAKINGRRSKTGVADVRLGLGYRFIHNDCNHLSLALQLSIPTGNKPRGEYLFEPVYGTRHVGLGGQFDGNFNIWNSDCGRIDFSFAVQYQYLFEATEKRTPSLLNTPMGHYFALGTIGQTNVPYIPAANILTRDCKVKPGSHLDALANLSFCSGGFILDVGYNLFWKDRESVWVKKPIENNVYGVPVKNTATNRGDVFDANNADILINDATVVVRDAAGTPTCLTHTVLGGIGYEFGDHCSSFHPFIAVGGAYEFASNDNDIERYSVWAKLGARF